MSVEPSPELKRLYNKLTAIVASLEPDIGKKALSDGSEQRLNQILDQLSSITSDDTFKDYYVEGYGVNGKGKILVMGSDYARNVFAAAQYCFEQYIGNPYGDPPRSMSHSSASGSKSEVNNYLAQQQESSNTVDVRVEFNTVFMRITEALANAEQEYDDPESSENKFIKAIKKALPTTKDVLGIMSLVLTLASKLNISPDKIIKILGL